MTAGKVRASWVAIITIIVLILLKVAVGLTTSSISIISQAVDSVTDLVASSVAFYSIMKSLQPPDVLHAYGHTKYENLASVVVGLVIIFTALLVAAEGVQELITGSVVRDIGLGVVVIGGAIIVNLAVSRYLFRAAKKEASMALEATATNLRIDILTNFGVFIGLLIISFTGWEFLDPLIAIAVSGYVIAIAIRLIRKASRGLLDESISPEEERTVTEVLAKHAPRFRSFHAIKTRQGGTEKYIELHLQVKGELSVREAHDLADHLEREIEGRLAHTTVTIHLEPEGSVD